MYGPEGQTVANAEIQVLNSDDGEPINHSITTGRTVKETTCKKPLCCYSRFALVLVHDGDYWRLLAPGTYRVKACPPKTRASEWGCSDERDVTVRDEGHTEAQRVDFILKQREDWGEVRARESTRSSYRSLRSCSSYLLLLQNELTPDERALLEFYDYLQQSEMERARAKFMGRGRFRANKFD